MENDTVRTKYTYEKHCKEMNVRGYSPMSEQHFNQMQESEIPEEPKVRPKRGAKPKPTEFKEYETI